MRFPWLSLLLALALAVVVKANSEKNDIWTKGDSNTPELRQWRSSLIEQGIEVLTPEKPTLRRKIHAAFPHSPPGYLGEPNEVWILLDGLDPNSRYEVRLSFSAMQPSTQNRSTYLLSEVWKEDALRQNLAKYLETRESHKVASVAVPVPSRPDLQQALYYIGVDPNYFTIDQKMMQDGILVEFDFILDPYVWYLIPASLIPVSIYLGILACIAVSLSSFVWKGLVAVARIETETKARTGDQNKDD